MSTLLQDIRDPEEDLVLLELLGEGSYGAVYRAERRADDTEVAVKIIPADNPVDLLKEVDIMMACASQYIVRLHDCYYKDNEAWLVMDFVGGGSVSDILEACQVTLSEEEARECTAWTVLALDYLHSNRKLHRDVKAGNILLTLDGRAKLADFGVSKEVNTMANKAQTAIGTPYWMAPEVIQEVPYDGQADIWSLAITCIEMVEGNPPLHNVHPMRAIFMIPSKPSPMLSEPPKWSLEFNDFVARCLEKKPDDRPSSRALLRHPWISGSVEAIQESGGEVGSAVIQEMVEKHLPVLTSFREEASDAKANLAGDYNEDCHDSKTATLRRMSSIGGENAFRGNVQLNASQGTATTSDRSGGTQCREEELDDGGDSSNGSVIRTPIGGDMDEDDEDNCSSHGSVVRHPVESYEEDGYSSGGSVVRLPIGTAIGFDAHPDEEDGYSSDDSVVRVPIPRGADDNKGDGYSSDGSVVRMLVGKECSKHGSERQRGQDDGTQAVSLGQPKDGDLGEEERGCAKEAPPISKNMNLQAAAKYFAKSGQGGASSGAASGQSNGSSHVIQHYEENPQAKALRKELERLDISFANELSKLRQTYDTKKTILQAQLRTCLENQRTAAPL